MTPRKNRFVLMRLTDSTFCQIPSDSTDATVNWSHDLSDAHQWVTFEAAYTAAKTWETLKGERVKVMPVATSTKNRYIEISV